MNDYENNADQAEAAKSKNDMTPETVLKGFVDHQVNALREAVKAVDSLLPDGFKQHGSASVREAAKSYRLLLDAGLEALNRVGKSVDEALKNAQTNVEDSEERLSNTGATKVRVEVE